MHRILLSAWLAGLLAAPAMGTVRRQAAIAVGSRAVIHILDEKDREVRSLALPARLQADFVMRGGVVAFFGDDFHLHWVLVEEAREVLTPIGPFLYGRPGFGPEVCRNLDIDPAGRRMVFEVKPMWRRAGQRMEAREFEELDEYAEICLADLNSGTVQRLSGGTGFTWRPWLVGQWLAFATPAGVGIRLLSEPRPLALNRVLAAREKRKSEVFLEVLAVEEEELILAEYAGADLKRPVVTAIWGYRPQTDRWRCLHRWPAAESAPEFTEVRDISPGLNQLLLVDEGDRVTRLSLPDLVRTPVNVRIAGPVAVRYVRP